MGTKRPFDEELQEFIKHPKHLNYCNKPALFPDNKFPLEASQNVGIEGNSPERVDVLTVPDMVDNVFETSAPLPLLTGITPNEEDAGPGPGPGPVFWSNIFPDFFEFNLPRRQPVHYDDTHSSVLYCSRRKEVPIGPDHQADVPEFDSEIARNCFLNYGQTFDNGKGDSLVGVCVIPMSNYDDPIDSIGEVVDNKIDCKCFDGGSIICVQKHVKEARLKLQASLGHEKFVDLGIYDMGEEVAYKWSEEEERIFHEIVYCNPMSLGKRFWEQLAIAFPSKTKKELVSYYFNVFILRRRAIQNRSMVLDIDSDDDEWRVNEKRTYGVSLEDQDFVIGEKSLFGHGDDDSSSEDGDGGTSLEDQESRRNSCYEVDQKSTVIIHEGNVTSQSQTTHGFLGPCVGKGWDPPYSSTRPTKGADLLPTCNIIEEIFGSSKNSKNTI